MNTPCWPGALLTALLLVVASAVAVPPPTLSPLSWDDRDDLLADLVPAAAEAAATLEHSDIYHLRFEIDPELERVRVDQEVLVFNRGEAPLDTLLFHLYPNLLGAPIDLAGIWLDGVPVAADYLPPQQRALRLSPATPTAPGEATVVRLAFELTVPRDIGRNYGLLAHRGGILSLAHGYALRAIAEADGELPLPAPQGDLVHAEASFYRVQVVAPQGLTVATTGVEVARHLDAGVQTTTFVAGPVRDFYLSASYGFELHEERLGDTVVRTFSLPGDRAVAQRISGTALAALTLFGARFGPYPYREFDLVPIDFAAFGIEFPGIVGLDSDLFGSDVPPGFLEGTTAHEVAHQWFYGLVGNDQMGEPWLDESLAQLATLQYFGDRYGPQGYAGFRASLEERWGQLGRRVVPIGRPVSAYSASAYGAIIYGLGPLVLLRLEEQLGRDTFATLLRDYVDDHRWGTATADDFKTAAERACSCDLTPFFVRWIGQ